jgi:hypothetical protein
MTTNALTLEDRMRRITLALATATAFGLGFPALANDKAMGQDRIQLAQADVKIKVGTDRPRERNRIVIRHDRGRHLGFEHSRHRGYGKSVTVIKRKPGGVVIKKRSEG